MKRNLFGKTIKQTFLAIPACALMLGASQAQTTIGINFAGGAYASYVATYGASCYSGYPVTATAFGVSPANWYTSTNGASVGVPYNYSANGSMIVGPASSLNVNWSSQDIWGTHIGFASATTNAAGFLAPPPGNDEVTWAFLDNSAWSVSLSGLNATFPNGYVIQCIAASGDTGTKVNSSSHITDGSSFTNSFNIYSVDGGFGSVGLLVASPTLTSDSLNLSPSGNCSLNGFIITDKPVVSWGPASITNNQGSPLVLSAGAIGIPPLSYQWRFNGVPIIGATSASYTNLSLAPTDAGNYDVIVTNIYGSVTSDIATVGVNQTPLITGDLSTATNIAYVGFSPVLSVVANGAQPLTYQWSANNVAVAGATNAMFAASSLAVGISSYNVVITNEYGIANSQTNYVSSIAAPDSYTTKVGPDAPTSYWPLNETFGSIAYDYSGYAHHGMISNSVTIGVAGPQPPILPGFNAGKTSYQFDGSTSFVDCGTNASLAGTNDFTVEAWVNTTAATAGEIVCQRDSNGYIGAYRCYMNAGGTLTFFLYGSGGTQFNFSSTATVNDGKWHQVVFVRQGTVGTIYVDGGNAGSASATVQALVPTIKTSIGANIRDSNNYFSGDIADVAIYNHALTAGQIINHYVTASGTPLTITMITGGLIQDSKPVGTSYPGLNFKTTWLASATDFNSVTRTGAQQFSLTNNSRISIPANADFNTTNGTLAFWVNYNEAADGFQFPGGGTEAAMLLDWRTSSGTIIGLNINNGGIEFQATSGAQINTAGQPNSSAIPIVDGNWHHVAVTYDQSSNGVVSVYIDGVLNMQANNPHAWSWPTNGDIDLGRSRDGYWKIYNGQMDDFRIYNRILTAGEVTMIGTASSSDQLIDATALKVRYNFDADSTTFGKSLIWPYGTLQSSPSLGSDAIWTNLTNAVSPQPIVINPNLPALFYRSTFTP